MFHKGITNNILGALLLASMLSPLLFIGSCYNTKPKTQLAKIIAEKIKNHPEDFKKYENIWLNEKCHMFIDIYDNEATISIYKPDSNINTINTNDIYPVVLNDYINYFSLQNELNISITDTTILPEDGHYIKKYLLIYVDKKIQTQKDSISKTKQNNFINILKTCN